MAATLTLVAASADALKYRWNYDGTGGAGSSSVVRTRAQMIADCAAGPLKQLLTDADQDAEWAALSQSAKLSAYTTMTTSTPGTGIVARVETVVPDGNALQVVGVDGNAGIGLVEIRFHHTLTR